MKRAFKVYLTDEEHGRLAGAARAMRGRPVYRDRDVSMRAIGAVGIVRELGKLEREFNQGVEFAPAEPTLGRPRKDQRR